MPTDIRGLHHVTALAADAQAVNDFCTRVLGLRRVKKTVNFDAPFIYHLYYGDRLGTPGTIVTYFPFPNIVKGRRGLGEVGETAFAVAPGTLEHWHGRILRAGLEALGTDGRFGEQRLRFTGPAGEGFALVEVADDEGGTEGDGGDPARPDVRGLRGVTLRLADAGATAALLRFMGYEETGREGGVHRYTLRTGGAGVVDLEVEPALGPAREGAGSVHHVAFAVADRAALQAARAALADAGVPVTPIIDRDYFWSIYFRSPGGVLFEIATNEPGFTRDEDAARLGESLRIPKQHAHLRARIERALAPIAD